MRTTDGDRRQKVGDVCLRPAIANCFRADSDIKQKRAATMQGTGTQQRLCVDCAEPATTNLACYLNFSGKHHQSRR